MAEAVRLIVSGRVQGVGFRYWTVRAATDLGLDGWVRNRRDGSVEILATGDPADLRTFVERCHGGPPVARVDRIERTAESAEGIAPGFLEAETV